MTPPARPMRAVIATAVFGVAGLAGLLFAPAPWTLRFPNAVFYAVLVLNTFFSVRYFDAQPPQERDERVIDSILAVNYLALAAAIGSPAWFAVLSGLLFALGIVKYLRLVLILHQPRPQRRPQRRADPIQRRGRQPPARGLMLAPLSLVPRGDTPHPWKH